MSLVTPNTVFTVGHSTHSSEHFVGLLQRHAITAVCDVRSRPYSRMAPQFNRDELKRLLQASGIQYAFLGEELGARSTDPDCYRKGRVQYDRMALTDLFRSGLKRVREGMATYRVALMCAEKEPLECHRTVLVGRHLSGLGLDVQHILADGMIERHEEAIIRLARLLKLKVDEQHMFCTPEELLAEAYRLQEGHIAYEAESEIDAELFTSRRAAG